MFTRECKYKQNSLNIQGKPSRYYGFGT